MAAHLKEMSVVKDLAADTLGELLSHMEDLTFSAGAWVRRSDKDDGRIYWIVEGRVELLRPLPEGGHQLVANLGEGEHFGRVGLLGTPSEHDARAVGDCKILALDADTLQHLLSADSEGHRAVKETLDLANFLDQVPELSGMGPSGRLDLAAMSIDHQAPEGKNVVVEGDQADSLYVIREGVCVVWRKGVDGQEEVLARLGPGQPFGEIGVLFNRTRGASVTCLEDCRLIEIPKQVLEHALRSSFHVGLAFERLATQRMQGAA
jgi:CRP-like cAMP-binding protein